ncbi:MAG: hypothetical protein WCP55_11480, partial [Lentisphaerota bacterium]
MGDSIFTVLADEKVAEVTKETMAHTAKRATVVAADKHWWTGKAVAFANNLPLAESNRLIIDNTTDTITGLKVRAKGIQDNLFMRTPIADEVVKLAYFGDSIFFSGFGTGVVDGTKGFGTLEYDHLAKRTIEHLGFNTPTFRSILHTDWVLTGSQQTKNAWSPYNSRYSGLYSILNTDTRTAQINGITGHERIVFVFEGGQLGNGTYDTGIAEILVSTDGGGNWSAPQEFDTAFEYPVGTATSKTNNTGSCPIREVKLTLTSALTYSFQIRKKSGETSPVHFWGCYYFTGQTFIPINVALPGASWNELKTIIYNNIALTGCQYAIVQAPI